MDCGVCGSDLVLEFVSVRSVVLDREVESAGNALERAVA